MSRVAISDFISIARFIHPSQEEEEEDGVVEALLRGGTLRGIKGEHRQQPITECLKKKDGPMRISGTKILTNHVAILTDNLWAACYRKIIIRSTNFNVLQSNKSETKENHY